MLLVGLGRFVQDLLLWCTAEFGYLRFGDGFVQSSSIMPQKRNPVAIEHVRAIGSKAFGQAQAILTAVHNTPFGDIVDTEDDLQPLVFSMFRDATRAVKLTAAALATAEFDVGHLEATRRRGLDDADRARRHADAGPRVAVSRRTRDLQPVWCRRAHASRTGRCRRSSSRFLRNCCGRPITYTDEALARILSPRHFVNVRRTLGGPAPDVTSLASRAAREKLDADRAWHSGATASLRSAEERLVERSARL